MPEGWPPLRACENEIRARPARALNPATPSTRLRAGPSVRGADRYRERDVCAPHFPPFELQSRPRCSAVVPLFLTPSPFTLSPSSSLKLLSLPSSSVHFGCRRIVPRSSLRSLAVVCVPPLIVVPSLLSGAVLDGTAIPRRYDSTTPSLFSFRFATFVFWQKICHAIDHPRRNLEPILEATLESYPIGAISEAYVHVIKWSSHHMFN